MRIISKILSPVGKIFVFFLTHKAITAGGILILAAGGYFGYSRYYDRSGSVRYITASAEKGILIATVTGTGQVSATNQTDIKSEVSGEVLAVNVTSGQAITSSTVIAQIDDSETRKELRDAQIAYENARLDLDELLAPADEIDIAKAESALEEAERNLEELVNPSEDDIEDAEAALIEARDDLIKLQNDQAKSYKAAVDAKNDAENDLEEGYEDAYNLLTSVFFDLPTVMTGLYETLYSYEIGQSEITLSNYSRNISSLENTVDADSQIEIGRLADSAEANYAVARAYYDDNSAEYKTLIRDADHKMVEDLLGQTVTTVKAMADTVKSESNLYDYWVDNRTRRNLPVFSRVTSYQSGIRSYTASLNSLLSSLITQQRALEDAREAIIDAEDDIEEMEREQPIDLAAAERTVKDKEDALEDLEHPEQYEIDDLELAVKEKEDALEKLRAGADDIDIRSQRITVQDKYDTLLELREKLEQHKVRAPFDGTIAAVDIAAGDTVNSGTLIGTVITDQRIVEVTLNEIDIASVKPGQNATINFDAVPDLTVTGKIVEVDTLGTITQGVVSYTVKIAFDVQDERIKPGMSTSVSIVISSKTDVLLVPLAALKTNGGQSYVEVLAGDQTQRKTVTAGDSNDTMIEITGGLNEGERVVTQTINADSTTVNGGSSGSDNRGGFNPGMMRMIR